MKVKTICPRMLCIQLRQEKTDPHYGSCLWAHFHFDLDNYDLMITSDAGDYTYGWTPTPKTESFLGLMCRVGSDYLLGKIARENVIDEGKTIEEIMEYLQDEDIEDDVKDRIKTAVSSTYSEDEIVSEISDILEGYTDVNPSEFTFYECICYDYPAEAKRIVELFRDYVKPAIRQAYYREMWSDFGDIPIDDEDRTLEKFHRWPAGANRFEIWKWFDEHYEGGVHALTEGTVT